MNSLVILDTNVLLTSISKRSRYRPIFDSLLNADYKLAISNEILLEYVEIIQQKANAFVASNVSELLLTAPNVNKINTSYRWAILSNDLDDNKFTDCAIAANAKYLVSNDRHFDVLKSLDVPKLHVISSDDFLNELKRK